MTKKRVGLIALPLVLIAILGVLQWRLAHMPPSQADKLLGNKAQFADQMLILSGTNTNLAHRIGLERGDTAIISSRKAIRDTLSLLRCSGTLSNPHDGPKSDEAFFGLEIVLLRNGGNEFRGPKRTEYLELVEINGRYRLKRYHLVRNQDYVLQGMATVDKRSLPRFLDALHLLVLKAAKEGKVKQDDSYLYAPIDPRP